MLTYLLSSTVLEFSHSKCQKSLYITTPLAFKSPNGDGDVARNRCMDRWIGEWCSYHFAAGSFHTKKLCSRLFSREVQFYGHKQRYRVFVPPFGGLRGNVHGTSMARWKARGRLPIGDNWTFFASYHAITVEALWADIGRNFAVWKGMDHFERKFHGERGVPHQRILASKN